MKKEDKKKKLSDFEKAGQEVSGQDNVVKEFVDFLKNNKKWWLAPIILVILLLGVLVILGGTGAAPFIYTIF